MIAVRDTIPTIAVKISTALVSNSIEVVSVNLLLRKPITLCCIYIPPCTDDLLLSEVIQYFSTLINSYPRNSLVLVGDFNLPDINWDNLTASSTASRTFCDFIFDNALLQVVDTSTHSKGNILDLIITNSEYSVRDLTIHSCGHLIISVSPSVCQPRYHLPLAPLQLMFMITPRLTTTASALFFLISTSPHAFYHMMLIQYGTQSSRLSMKE